MRRPVWHTRLTPSSRRGSQGNHYTNPGGSNSKGSSYHYSNSNGSYYYKNDNGASSVHTHSSPSVRAQQLITGPEQLTRQACAVAGSTYYNDGKGSYTYTAPGKK